MFKKLFKLFDSSEKEYINAVEIAKKIDALDAKMQSLTEEELKAKTPEFRERFANGESLDDLLVEAFAVVREASDRLLGLKPYFVQLVGGIILHYGNIAEMKTGEGKTLTSVAPAYLNALSGDAVHIVTVNEYLASREADGEIGDLFRYLGLSVGLNIRGYNSEQKRDMYNCDILYSTNSEIGFDYLRDNMVLYAERRVMQRKMCYAIIDEIDSILIDEARTPLIISGGTNENANLYHIADSAAKSLKEKVDFEIEVKSKAISLTSEGIKKCENYFNVDNLYDLANAQYVHFLHQALKANYTLAREVDYIVSDGEILIVDQFTGRLMEGRSFSEGLHQAIEAKENVTINDETKTMATITYQNLFRMYSKLSGMTGTAKTEEEEFRDIYNMYVVSIPTNRPIIREDRIDLIFGTAEGKFKRIVNDVKNIHSTGQPILVGTIAVETSEYLSKLLTKAGIKHEVLNAKNHLREAEIIANAGKLHAVTIATNMAGRGTDIKLGEGVKELGGLFVLGTELHESRRIDNQLKGRSGRQGDPGVTQFYASFDDQLLVRFGYPFKDSMKQRVDSEPLEMSLISKQIERAQKQIEGNNFDMRKRVLEYDSVMSKQRQAIYQLRNEILETTSYHERITELIKVAISDHIYSIVLEEGSFNANVVSRIGEYVCSHYFEIDYAKFDTSDQFKFEEQLSNEIIEQYELKLSNTPEEINLEFEKIIALRVFDTHWMKHIDTVEHLKEGIGLRSYAQQNPLREYSMEAKALFDEMMANINKDIVQFVLRSQIRQNEERKEVIKGTAVTDKSKENAKKKPLVKKQKIGVNSPCPCGSGKKYKVCCGK